MDADEQTAARWVRVLLSIRESLSPTSDQCSCATERNRRARSGFHAATKSTRADEHEHKERGLRSWWPAEHRVGLATENDQDQVPRLQQKHIPVESLNGSSSRAAFLPTYEEHSDRAMRATVALLCACLGGDLLTLLRKLHHRCRSMRRIFDFVQQVPSVARLCAFVLCCGPPYLILLHQELRSAALGLMLLLARRASDVIKSGAHASPAEAARAVRVPHWTSDIIRTLAHSVNPSSALERTLNMEPSSHFLPAHAHSKARAVSVDGESLTRSEVVASDWLRATDAEMVAHTFRVAPVDAAPRAVLDASQALLWEQYCDVPTRPVYSDDGCEGICCTLCCKYDRVVATQVAFVCRVLLPGFGTAVDGESWRRFSPESKLEREYDICVRFLQDPACDNALMLLDSATICFKQNMHDDSLGSVAFPATLADAVLMRLQPADRAGLWTKPIMQRSFEAACGWYLTKCDRLLQRSDETRTTYGAQAQALNGPYDSSVAPAVTFCKHAVWSLHSSYEIDSLREAISVACASLSAPFLLWKFIAAVCEFLSKLQSTDVADRHCISTSPLFLRELVNCIGSMLSLLRAHRNYERQFAGLWPPSLTPLIAASLELQRIAARFILPLTRRSSDYAHELLCACQRVFDIANGMDPAKVRLVVTLFPRPFDLALQAFVFSSVNASFAGTLDSLANAALCGFERIQNVQHSATFILSRLLDVTLKSGGELSDSDYMFSVETVGLGVVVRLWIAWGLHGEESKFPERLQILERLLRNVVSRLTEHQICLSEYSAVLCAFECSIDQHIYNVGSSPVERERVVSMYAMFTAIVRPLFARSPQALLSFTDDLKGKIKKI